MIDHDTNIKYAYDLLVELTLANNLNGDVPAEGCILFTDLKDWMDLEVQGGSEFGKMSDLLFTVKATRHELGLILMYVILRGEPLRKELSKEVQDECIDILATDKRRASEILAIFSGGIPHATDLTLRKTEEETYGAEDIHKEFRKLPGYQNHTREY